MPILPLGQRMMRSHLADCLSHIGFEMKEVQSLMDFQKHNRLISSTEAYLFGWDYWWLIVDFLALRPLFTGVSLPLTVWLSEESCWYGCLALQKCIQWMSYWWTKQVKTWLQWLFVSNATDQWVFSLNLWGTLGSQISFSTYLQVF